jgi:phosphatidylethanolamine-binding protein (PEBP) family uncharacterized protein
VAPTPRPERRRIVPALLVMYTMIACAACGSSGRALREPGPGITSPPPSATTSTTIAAPTTFTIQSPTIGYGSEVPATYTCAGKDISPPLEFSVVPPGLTSLALVVTTSDDSTTEVNWVVTGIPPTTTQLTEGTKPPGTELVAWKGPCPKKGRTDTVDFVAYALSGPFTPPPAATPAQVKTALDKTATEQAAMSAVATGS